MILRYTRFFLVAILTLAATGCSKETTDPSDSTADTDVEWSLHGNDWGEQRYSPLDQVNRENVSELGLAWYYDIPTNRGIEATPLMVDGTLYVTGSWSIVYALDAVTGEEKWVYDPRVDKAFLAKGCCDAVNRGAAYHDGKVIVGAYDGRLIALDADDGSVIWDVQTTDRDQSYTITGAPRIAGNKVVIGNGGADLGVRGYVSAYDVDTGEMAWRFYTVPGNPADGFENDAMAMAATTWTGEWWKWGGGGTAWDSMVYDPELELLYIGVGNGSPRNQDLRSPEGGDNLFLASIVAVRPDTGEYVWHYQTTPGESWDFTATQPMMLVDLTIGGELRKVLLQAPKNGFFYVLDRATGKLISAEPYTQTTWATGIDLESGRPIENPKARDFDDPIAVMPFMGGGHNWAPMSYNPETGLIYFGEMSIPQSYATPVLDIDKEPGHGYWNTGFNSLAAAPPPIENLDEFMEQIAQGKLVAWDPVTQEARWTYDHGRFSFSGTLSTAGMLVFQGDGFDRFNAFDAESGSLLWSTDAQTMAMAAPISYAIDGEQYVAVAVGYGGGPAHEGGALTHGMKLRNRSRVLVYKLGGERQLPPRPESGESPMPKPAPVTADAETVAQGQVLYEKHCSACHGGALRSGGINPDLRRSSPEVHEAWQSVVHDGALAPLGMVGFDNFMSEADAEAIRQYVLAEANRVYSLEQADTQSSAN